MNSSLPPALSQLSYSELADLLRKVIASERASTLDSIRLFIEMRRRHAHSDSEHDSLFTFCVQELHLSEGYTYRRLTAAKLLARFPNIEPFIADGRISLSNLVLLKDALTPENHLSVLERATHLTKLQTKELLAELNPRPDVLDSVRRLPTRSPLLSSPPSPAQEPAPALAPTSPPGTVSTPAASNHPPAPTRAPSHPEPLSPGRYLLKTTISADTRAKLEKVQAALSHLIPDGNLEDVLDEALTLALGVLAKQHRVAPQSPDVKTVTFAAKAVDSTAALQAAELATTAEVAASALASSADHGDDDSEFADDDRHSASRYIPADVKRAVRLRDGDRCTFVGSNGRRCSSTHQLEFHHRVAHALGGLATVDNITLHCRAHNRVQAVIDFGAAHMARFSASYLPASAPVVEAGAESSAFPIDQ